MTMKIQLKNEHNSEPEDRNQDLVQDLVEDPAESQLKPRFSISRILMLLNLIAIGTSSFLGYEYLTNPASPALFLLPFYQAPVAPVQNLNPPQTLAEITKELADLQLQLGERLQIEAPAPEGLYIYPTIDKTKEIEEIRVYQTISEDVGKGKLRLVQKLEVMPLDEHYIRSIELRYSQDLAKVKPTGNKMPLMKLSSIEGTPPSKGIWFMAIGSKGKTNYGQIFCYVPQPQPKLNQVDEWVIPAQKLPEWRNFLEVKRQEPEADPNPPDLLLSDQPELVIDQTQSFEPDFQVFRVQPTASLENPLQLRQITLNEALKSPQNYSDALVLASGGLWSPSIAKFDRFKAELQAKGKSLSPFMQEQYELIDYHAKITAEQADRTLADSGQQALMLILDGRWQEALKIAEASDFAAKSVAEMMVTDNYHVWPRVKAALKVKPELEVKIWGALVFLQRKGLPEAVQWLTAQKASTERAIALLQRSDISPLKMKPEQLLGTVTPLGKGSPGTQWQIKFPDLLPGQVWFRVDVSVIKDGNTWINGAFPEIGRRSPILVWEALGLEQNNFLTATLTDINGIRETSSLTARSISIGADGSLKILATGYDSLAKSIDESRGKGDFLPLVTSDNIFTSSSSSTVYLQNFDQRIEAKIIQALYNELQKVGQVSLELEDFKSQIAIWSFQSIDITGDNQLDFILELDRNQIDAGDRYYPVTIAFDRDGNILFSDISANSGRRWITILPGNNAGQVLTQVGDRYEVWSLR